MQYLWTTYSVFDLDATIAFYHDLLGLKVVRRFAAGPQKEIAFLGTGKPGETLVELCTSNNARDLAHSTTISLGFAVADLDKVMAQAEKMDVPIHSGPFSPDPSIRFCFVLDPNGVKIQLAEQKNA
jgi:lactoylglutathione lyase